MFVFILVVWTFSFNKYMIQNPVFFVYNVTMLSIVYAIVLSLASQAHVSRKSQRLIHERVTRCVTRCKVTKRNRWKFEHVITNSMGNEIWSIYNDKHFEI